MKTQVKQLNPNDITSDIYMISAAQVEYIAGIFTKNFADTMNMRTFSGRINEIARESLRTALKSAKTMGNKC